MTSGFGSFGRVGRPAAGVLKAGHAIALLDSGAAKPGSLLAYGNGRSYGDSCLNADGSAVDMRGMNRILSFDPETGVLEAEAGAMLSDLIRHAAPFGYFPAVVPGTQWVTLGGAVANDIHGKNHHRRGTFGRHVEALTLLTSDGKMRRINHEADPNLFAATVGGMGLTGLILSVSVRLMRVASLDIEQKIAPFRDLPEYFELAEAADGDNEYAVAWIDQLAGGRKAGRGLLITGNHAEYGARSAGSPRARLGVPAELPFNMLNRPFLTVFNAAYRWSKGRRQGEHKVGYDRFFFPLDGVRDWNRLYGPKGLYQHQGLVPDTAARQAIPALLQAAREAGQGSFLTVLKRFGELPSQGILSFPRPGYTLTLDFPNRGPETLRLLERLDRITMDAGGAVNPYKDARMGAEVFAASFPDWRELEARRDPVFISDFWRRTARVLLDRGEALAHAAE